MQVVYQVGCSFLGVEDLGDVLDVVHDALQRGVHLCRGGGLDVNVDAHLVVVGGARLAVLVERHGAAHDHLGAHAHDRLAGEGLLVAELGNLRVGVGHGLGHRRLGRHGALDAVGEAEQAHDLGHRVGQGDGRGRGGLEDLLELGAVAVYQGEGEGIGGCGRHVGFGRSCLLSGGVSRRCCLGGGVIARLLGIGPGRAGRSGCENGQGEGQAGGCGKLAAVHAKTIHVHPSFRGGGRSLRGHSGGIPSSRRASM